MNRVMTVWLCVLAILHSNEAYSQSKQLSDMDIIVPTVEYVIYSDEKRNKFNAWSGKRSPFYDYIVESDESPLFMKRPNFGSWGGKRIPASENIGSKRFNPWGGKRGVEKPFRQWGGKRDPEAINADRALQLTSALRD